MADEFQVGVCGGNWWSNSRNMVAPPSSLLCSPGGSIDDIAGFGWSGELFEMKSGGSISDESASASDGSVVIQDVQQPLNDANSHWNHLASFTNNGRCESNYSPPPMLQQDLNPGMNFRQRSGMDCPTKYDNTTRDSSTNTNKPVVDQNFGLEHQQHIPSITTSSSSFPLNSSSSSYAYPNDSTNLMQTLFDSNVTPPMDLPSTATASYFPSLGDFSPSLSNFSPTMLKPSLPKQQQQRRQASWIPSPTALCDVMPTLLPTTPLTIPLSRTSEKTNLRNLTAKRNNGEGCKKSNEEGSYKRPRIETPSPLPTFKVRKEKLGDRITALQQLVSPFGKTDTASVLHEAIDYIKFLHDQVRALSAPYMKNGSPGPRKQQGGEKSSADQEGSKHDLRSRGLCLLPISSTFPVAAETTTDFWAPTTFGAAFG